ncbi:Aa trans domain-containing protein [Citrus sinensis]|uniref:Aa trans domain-containing protein n=1 Tax=Citrus sinensis TaxID=2711 RepID=A0ACB8P6M9_CITSI|nr:Aa trans domain-containing protein [Citrus sinensis]
MSTPLHENEKKEVSFLKTCINGINALSGIGILSVPYALSSGGRLSLIIFVLIAAEPCFTALLIRRCMDKDPDAMTSYIDIVGHAFARKGRVIASLFICLELYFVATGLLILEGDNLHKLSPHFDLKLGKLNVDGRHSFVVLAGVMILPTMWLNDLGVLSYVSAGGVLLISFAICTITYPTMAVLGYLIYGQNVQSQVTLNLATEQVSSKVVIYTILAGPIAKYALTVMPIATAIENRLPANYKDCKSASILIRMSLLVSTVVLAAVFPSFQSVTSLSGAFLIVAVSFLLPCVCYLKIFQVHRNWGYELIGILIIMLLVVFVGVLGTYSSIAQTVKQV